jgi:hypothetical protein
VGLDVEAVEEEDVEEVLGRPERADIWDRAGVDRDEDGGMQGFDVSC